VAADTDEAGGAAGAGGGLNQASAADTARIAAAIFGPPVAGTVVRRWHFLAERAAGWDLNGRSLRVLHQMRRRYGTAPLRLNLPKPRVYMVLDPDHVNEVMRLSPVQPGAAAEVTGPLSDLIDQEAARINTFLDMGHTFGWPLFAAAWWRIVEQAVNEPPRADFDAAAAAVFRTLAMLATHPQAAELVADDEYARACLRDTMRLFPTTSVIRRYTTRPTEMGGMEIPARSTLVIHSGFFHRDPLYLAYADQFRPQIWLDGSADRQPGIVPSSAGEDVERTAVATVAALARPTLRLSAWTGPRLSPDEPLPVDLDHFSLRFGRPT
jgi:Cytochrome P450